MSVGPDQPPAVCPSCHARGELGEPCGERICSIRGYHFVPADSIPEPTGADDGGLDPGVGQRLGDYLLIGLLGVGGFGKVFTALQLPVGMLAAVKVLDMETGPAGMARIKLTKFEVEAQALARLSHPNIVRLYHYGHHRGQPYLAMELVEDATNLWGEIEARAAASRPFTLDEIETVLMQVLAALEAAHARNMVHRDIKPENIMLQFVSGHGLFVKVLDFGLAKFSADRTATSLLLGTPAYMAQEQLTRGPLGPWTDVFALGVVAFELITGHRPYPGSSVQETLAFKLDPDFDPWTRVEHLGLPHEVRVFFAKCLSQETEARYGDVSQMREGLERAFAALRRARTTPYLVQVNRLVEPTELRAPSLPPDPPPDPTRRLARPKAAADSDELDPHRLPKVSVAAELQVADPPAWAPPPPDTALGNETTVIPELMNLRPSTRPPDAPPIAAQRSSPPRASARRLWLFGLLSGIVLTIIAILAIRSGEEPARDPTDPMVALPATKPTTARRPAVTSSVRILNGRFARGTAPHDPQFRADETLHEVILTQGLVAEATEVTQGRWRSVFPTSPWSHGLCGEDCPVENVSWWDAVAYANALSQREGRTPCYTIVGCRGVPGDGLFACQDARFSGVSCDGWRLPTEAEWEYLARAQSPPPALDKVAWHAANAEVPYGIRPCPEPDPRPGADPSKAPPPRMCGTHPVATRAANAFGLYDLFGNVREWVHDAYGDYPARSPLRDPTGPGGSGDRVIRGGSFMSPRHTLRAAARDRAPPSTRSLDLGFRLVRSVK